MSRDRLSRRCRRLLERLSQPSSAAGLAAMLALLVPQLAEHGPAIVDLELSVVAIGAAFVAMVSAHGHFLRLALPAQAPGGANFV